jgi:hypothetical protein
MTFIYWYDASPHAIAMDNTHVHRYIYTYSRFILLHKVKTFQIRNMYTYTTINTIGQRSVQKSHSSDRSERVQRLLDWPSLSIAMQICNGQNLTYGGSHPRRLYSDETRTSERTAAVDFIP